jgi:hypothetical protein
MNPPQPNGTNSGGIDPRKLVSINVRIEAEEDLTVRPARLPQPPSGPVDQCTGRPTTDQLAGVYVLIEGPEDLTVRPRATPHGGSDGPK